jgi:hypothetical protein
MHKYVFGLQDFVIYLFRHYKHPGHNLHDPNIEGNARPFLLRPHTQHQLKLTPVRPSLRLCTPMTHRVPLDNFRETKS